jgi:hypothetical protein
MGYRCAVILPLSMMCVFLPASQHAQARLQVGPAINVFADTTLPHLVEPWLAVSPQSSNTLAVVALFEDFSASMVATSHDGGGSWGPRLAGGARFPGGDPTVLAGLNGRFFVATIDPRLRVWTSANAGADWSSPTELSVGAVDREWLAQDQTAGPNRGRVYVAGKTGVRIFGSRARDIGFVAFSSDDARTFSAPRLFMPNPNQESLHTVTDLQVANDGAVLMPYLAFSWTNIEGPELLHGSYWLVTSVDGGRSFSDPRRIADVRLHGHSNESMSVKALGGGRLAVDRTAGQFRNRRYFVFPNSASGVPRVSIVRADSDGPWSAQVAVSDGPPARSESNPAVAVGEDGLVAVTWNDRRNDPNDRCYQAYIAVSMDGGDSFLPAEPLGARPVCPADGRWLNGGDTQGIIALPGRRFMAAWVGADGQRLRIWATVVTVGR